MSMIPGSIDGDEVPVGAALGAGRPRWRRLLPSLVAAVVIAALYLAVILVPLPYVIFGPGPTFDVLGKQGDTPILQVEGAQSAAAQSGAQSGELSGTQSGTQSGGGRRGELRMVTISELGGPGTTVTAADLLQAWLRPGNAIHRYSDIYPADVTSDQMQKAASLQMQSSHSTASVAALEYLGYSLPTVITVVGASKDMGAAGKVQPGDILVSITTPDGTVHPMTAASAPFALLDTVPAGTDLRVTLMRDGKQVTEDIVTAADPTDKQAPGSKLGIMLSFDITMPLTIDFNLEKVGGPSAGTIFALGIIDELTGGDLAGDKIIAGTGAMGYNGTVQPIGGVVQKMFGAKRDGAEYFLAPRANCGEVVGHEPRGLQVFAIGTLSEAVETTKAIASGDVAALPTCEAALAEDGQSS